jgi:hypothetical protein
VSIFETPKAGRCLEKAAVILAVFFCSAYFLIAIIIVIAVFD